MIHEVNLNGHTGIPGAWTQVLDVGLWKLDPGRYILDAGLWTLGTFSEHCFSFLKHWTLFHLTVSKKDQNPVFDSA